MKSRPVICQLLHSMNVGGAEMLAARIVRQTCDQYRYCFCCLDELGTLGEELISQGFPVKVIHRKPGFDWRCPIRIARYLQQHHVDLIHAHQYTPFFYALLARVIHWHAPILFTEHGRHQPDYPRRKRMVFNRAMLQRRDHVLGVGEAVRQALIVNEGIPPGRAHVLYNGVDLSHYENVTEEQRLDARRELGVDENDLVIVQVARLDPIKDHGTALRAMELVSHRHSNVKFRIIGEGPEAENIRSTIEKLRLENCITMMGLRKDVPKLLLGADLFLLSSVSEGIPLTIIEAMGASLSVVSTNAGGVHEVVRPEKTGLLAPIGDHVQLAEQIMKLIERPDLRRQMGQRGHELAHQKFSEPKMLQQYDQLYREMIRQ